MRRALSGLFLLILFSSAAVAGISLDATRVVFRETMALQGQSIGVTSSKQSSTPYLVRAQIVTSPDGISADTPFVVSPSLFRLEPGMTNQMRIMQRSGNLPQDRELVYYLRVVAQPAGKNNTKETGRTLGGALVVSTASVIKVFYRPSGLSVSMQQAMASLQFSRKGQHLYVYNPSPYFISLSSLTVGGQNIPVSVKKQNTMLAPFSGLNYQENPPVGQVTWKAINDYGGTEVFHGELR
ncbi:fimbria/pilus periplasmic chaperone [Providencia alcalifaciens]|uniref:fimbrial biogenesis chaperone n=1 Tax=Providencia TaxID=586 RepID=UPI0012B5BEE3|nr:MULTISPECIES: molecular chaperone [Providencia]MTC48279.1 fimbria/pilus periplasmic chaperone [Providencia alcalifaciens]